MTAGTALAVQSQGLVRRLSNRSQFLTDRGMPGLPTGHARLLRGPEVSRCPPQTEHVLWLFRLTSFRRGLAAARDRSRSFADHELAGHQDVLGRWSFPADAGD